MKQEIITKKIIEEYIVLEFDNELNKILQYKYNNYIFNMYDNYDPSTEDLDLIIKKIILNSWFIKNKKLHKQICKLFNYDENDASKNIFKHTKAIFHNHYEFFFEEWFQEQIRILDESTNVWKTKLKQYENSKG